MNQLIVRILFLLFGLLIGLGVAEITLRVFHLAPEVVYIEKWRMRLAKNPKIGYEPIPHLDSSGKSVQYYGYRGLSNDLGFRDESHTELKPAGETRILVLGDSIVAGLWIEKDRDIYPALLEEKLRAEGKKVEVLNFGVSGYNTQQEVETLKEKGLRYSPDIVLLTYCLNDTYADDGGIYYHLKNTEKEQDGVNAATLSPWLRKSALFRFMKFRVMRQEEKKQEDLEAPDFLTENKTAQYLSVLSELQKQHGFEVYVVFFPDFDFLDKRTASYAFFDEHQKIRKLALQNNFQFIDLYDSMKKCKAEIGNRLLSYDRFHPRPIGNDCAASAIAQRLRESKKIAG